jgi:fumarase (EC 4.2.1.2)
VLRGTALDLYRLSQDLRLMFSGPFTGLNEIDIPSQEEVAGSSIMPGKTNPITVESCLQASVQVMGLDHAVQLAGMLGEFELSMGIPLTGYDVVTEIGLLSEALTKMAKVVIENIVPNEEKMKRYAESSPSLITVISPKIGYDKASKIGKQLAKGMSIREALKELGYSDKEIDEILDLKKLVKGGYALK